MMANDFVIRQAGEDDMPFIFSTWLRNYRHSSTGFAQDIDKEVYYDFHHQVISRIVSRHAHVLLAVDKQDPTVIFGYLVLEWFPDKFSVIHYGYVKKAFRNLGLFNSLLKAASVGRNKVLYTHKTELGEKLIEHKKGVLECQYNPYLI